MHDDDLNENHVFDVIRDRLSKLTVAKPPPVEAIVARGRARRRRSGLAGMGLAAVGLAIALPVIITSVNPAAPAVATHLRLGGGPVHVNLAAYSVDSNANGTVTVALAAKQSFNPSELRQVLAQAGIAAVVNVDAFCQTADQPAGFQAVVSSSGRNWAAKSAQSLAGRQTAEAKLTAMVIKPSAMPKRAELSIGYFPDHVAMTLVKVGGRMSCFSSDPPTCNVPLGARGQSVSSSYGSDVTTLPSATATLPSATTTTLPSATTTLPSATTTLPSAATTTASSATTTMPPAASTTVPAQATRSFPTGSATSVPPAAQDLPPVVFRCQAPAPGAAGINGGTGAATSTLLPSASTTVPTSPTDASS
jgi:hypothetical protein